MKTNPATLATAALLTLAANSPVHAQKPSFDDLKRATDDVSALVDAENSKSALCKSYVGKVLTPTAFDALVRAVPKVTEKSEFETTAQYQARLAAANAQTPGGPYVLSLPVQRDYLRYDADAGAMFVERGAFRTGQYSDEPLADLSAWGAKDVALDPGTPIFHSRGPAKLVKTYAARSRSGVPFRVSEFERHTSALYVTSGSLFAFAKDKDSRIMGFDVPLARAPAVKDALKVALVVIPQTPYLYQHSMGPIVPSLGTPNIYKEFVTVAFVAAKCGLALDGQNRVLASADAGT